MKLLTALALFTVIALPKSANAATIVFDLCTVAAQCNLVQMQTTLVGGNITVSVTSAGLGLGGNDIFGTPAVGFNVVGSTAGLAVTGITAGFGWGDAFDPASLLPYGSFQTVVYDCNAGSPIFLPSCLPSGSNPNTPLNFTVSRTAGFTSDLDLFGPNASGYLAAAQVRNNQTGTGGSVATRTLPAAPVPEPGTMILLGTGLLAAAWARKAMTAKK